MEKKAHILSNAELLRETEDFLQLTQDKKEILQKLEAIILPHAEALEKAFYDKIRSMPTTAEFLEGSNVESRHVVSSWVKDLLKANYDEAYFMKRCQIGITHVRIGLPIRYPIMMMEIIRNFFSKAIQENFQGQEALTAQNLTNQLLSLDLAIFSHAYEETLFDRLDQSAGISRELFYSLIKSVS